MISNLMRGMLLCTLEAVEAYAYVLELPEAVEGVLCLLEVPEVLKAVDSVFCLLCSVCWSSWR